MKSAIRIAVLYALLSGFYILLSDAIALEIARRDPEILTQWQSLKGLAFVVASAVIIFFLVLHYARQRDRTARLLEEARDSFEQLFQRNPLPILVYDTSALRILAVNDAAVAEYGFPRPEFLHLTMPQIHPEPDFEKLLAHVARTKSHPYQGQWQHRRKDGTEFDVEILSHPMVFAGQQARLAVAVNISSRKLTERALAEAFAAKEDAGDAKTRFLSTMSHEMRTPLNAITGCLDLLLKEPDPARRREFTTIAQRGADDLLALIERVIDAAALSSRTVRRETREIELEPFFRRLSDATFPAAMRKNIKLDLALDPSLPRQAVLDVHRLQETLQILLGNAIKFSHGGTVTLSARLHREATHALLEIIVADEGIGIPPAQQGRVFDSFFQVDQNLTRKYGGAGMGLFVAKQLCDLMGATVEVKSRDGAGSLFQVSLPGWIEETSRFVAGDRERPEKTLETPEKI